MKELLKEAERKAYKDKCKIWVYVDKFGTPDYTDEEPIDDGYTEIVVVYDHSDYSCEWEPFMCGFKWQDAMYEYLSEAEKAEFNGSWYDEDERADWLRTLEAYEEFEDADIDQLIQWHDEDGDYDI